MVSKRSSGLCIIKEQRKDNEISTSRQSATAIRTHLRLYTYTINLWLQHPLRLLVIIVKINNAESASCTTYGGVYTCKGGESCCSMLSGARQCWSLVWKSVSCVPFMFACNVQHRVSGTNCFTVATNMRYAAWHAK